MWDFLNFYNKIFCKVFFSSVFWTSFEIPWNCFLFFLKRNRDHCGQKAIVLRWNSVKLQHQVWFEFTLQLQYDAGRSHSIRNIAAASSNAVRNFKPWKGYIYCTQERQSISWRVSVTLTYSILLCVYINESSCVLIYSSICFVLFCLFLAWGK
jgi:hypothetical protein